MSETVTKKKLVVVLGMHRSGTSAISNGLQVMGVELGDRLMPPNPEVNAKGFWEDIDLNALNIQMLESLGSDWQHLAPITSADVEDLKSNGYFCKAVELLKSKVGDAQVFGYKDPRVAKLLPFWKQVYRECGFETRYVVALRHPLSVVKSLGKRDGLAAVKSYVLWLEHVISSLSGTVGSDRVVVDYDLLMSAPEHELHRIAQCLELSIDTKALQTYKAEFLDESLRHSIYDLTDLLHDKSCPPLVREVYEVLRKVAAGAAESDVSLQQKVELWAQEFDRIVPVLELVDELAEQNAKFSQSVLEWANRNKGLETGNVLRDMQLEVAAKILHETSVEISGLNEQVVKLQDQVDARAKQAGELQDQISLLTTIITENTESAIELNSRLADRDRVVAELTDETVRRGEWALGLDRQLSEAQTKIKQITSSNSWRITLPMREARRWVSSPLVQAKRYLKLAIVAGNTIYFWLPLGPQTRAALRRFVAKYFPWVLRAKADKPVSFPVQSFAQRKMPTLTDLRAAAGSIKLDSTSQPLVSIIIPVYGQCEYTLKCLQSIAEHKPSVAYEVIVVDDCSPDETFEILQAVSGIQLVKNSANQGFIRSCNYGSKLAKGYYVYFLNNDTQVTAGWLDELVRTFEALPGTGLAGSKLVYPDGTLQEAGGIIWQDGSAWNFGRNQDPQLPVFNYAREVDYCSGASIMIPKQLFGELGGFDEHYLPAYCEDADLALKIRQLGHRVIYQPLSVVVHFEGVTSGTDTTKGVKAYQIENSKKMFERWQELLRTHQQSGVDADNAKDRCAKRRVLVLDHCTPTPNQDAGSVTVFNLMILLREMGFQVTFIPEDNFLYMPEYTTDLQRRGIEVLYAPYVTTVEKHLKESNKRYDLALLFRPGVVERHLKIVRKYCPMAKVLFHTVDLHYLRMTREAELLNDAAKLNEAEKMKQRELSIIREVDSTIVHSTAELELLNTELPNEHIHVFPLILNIAGSGKTFQERRDIVFVGGYQHVPNVDAVLYFVTEIMPILRQRLPGVRFHAVGSKPPAEILKLVATDVVIAGFVEDLNSLLDRMRVSVAPLRYGAGIKGKIGTAMAVGLPIVATSIAAEGMSLTNGKNILVADGAESFADAVIRLYQDPLLWQAISKESTRFADEEWGAEAAWKILASILAELGFETKHNDRVLKLYSA